MTRDDVDRAYFEGRMEPSVMEMLVGALEGDGVHGLPDAPTDRDSAFVVSLRVGVILLGDETVTAYHEASDSRGRRKQVPYQKKVLPRQEDWYLYRKANGEIGASGASLRSVAGLLRELAQELEWQENDREAVEADEQAELFV